MNDELFIGLVKQLNEARKSQDKASQIVQEHEDWLYKDSGYIKKKKDLAECNEQVQNLEKILKTQLIEDPEYAPPFKAAWLINSTKVSLDEKAALEWAKANMPVAVSEVIDKKMLTDWAKGHREDAPFANVTECKEARIASDLDKFVKYSLPLPEAGGGEG